MRQCNAVRVFLCPAVPRGLEVYMPIFYFAYISRTSKHASCSLVCMFESSVSCDVNSLGGGPRRCRDVPLELVQRVCPENGGNLAPLMLAALLSPSFLLSSSPETDLNGLLLLPELVR